MSCRMPGCHVQKLQRFGLCNKHRKWVEKGFIDQNLKRLKPPTVRMKKHTRCKLPWCELKFRKIVKGFCNRHYRWLKAGIIAKDGQMLRQPKPVKIARDVGCVVCGKTGKITRGFCSSHYTQFQRGIIDFDGVKKRELKRIPRYTEFHFCKVKPCRVKPRSRGFCANHFEAFSRGSYDDAGRRLTPFRVSNKGHKCKVCERPAHIRKLCKSHYQRRIRGLPLVREFKNKGKPCKAIACKSDAYALGLCMKHYGRHRARRIRAQATQESAHSHTLEA